MNNAKLQFMEQKVEFEPIELHRMRNSIKNDIRRMRKLDMEEHPDIEREIDILEESKSRIDTILHRMEESMDPETWANVLA